MNTKKTLVTIGFTAVATLSANAQNLVAGWDFADVLNLAGTNVNGYMEKTNASNNGFGTSGQIYIDGTNGSTSITQGTQTTFNAYGAAAGNPGFSDGFDQTASQTFSGPATGQQALTFIGNHGGSFNVVFGFTTAQDVVMNFDWLTSTTGFTTDILDISYSNDGTSYTPYDHAGRTSPGYWAGGSTTSWAQSTGSLGGLSPAFGDGQPDMEVDLIGLGDVSFVRLEFSGLGSSEQIAIDNVHIAGTAVPEPSAFAAIAGALALAFVGARRRK